MVQVQPQLSFMKRPLTAQLFQQAGNSMAVRMPDSAHIRALDIDPPNAAYDATTVEDAETSNGSVEEDAIISEFLEVLDEKSFSPTTVFLPMALLMQHMVIVMFPHF